ncbi:response regulator [Leptolyngbya ohadii]|uniref:response regulator n=1 Tax=Leptolyngbya ohadii TaxID=1962290 RepID=UPI000B59CF47|nr:response regulator [Leptolyngbya ohadii]
MLRILLVDDNQDDRALAIRQLKQALPAVLITEAGTAEAFEQALTELFFDVVITDYQLRWSNGLTVLKRIKAHHPDCPVVMFTNTATQATAVEAMKSGLDDYVIKSPSHYVRLPAAVKAALERVAAKRQAASLQARIQTLLNQLDVGIYRLTSEGALLEGNAAFLRLVGLERLTEVPADQTLEPYFRPQDYAELLVQLKQNGEVRDREVQLRCADGSTRWVKLSKTFTRTDGTTIIDGLMEDITERKQAEAQAEREKCRSQFLSEASRLLATSLDHHTTLENLANLAVPALANICFIDVIEPNSILFGEPILATSDPNQATLLLELRRRYPPRTDTESGIGKVLRTGQSELRSEIPNSLFGQIAQDADHLELLQQLGAKAWIIVPLAVQDRKFGTIALVLTQATRCYDRTDLEMAEELARRTAIALDNVRLYQEAQQANLAKDEFLAIVSHELRNPLNSMLGWAQLLRKRQFEDPTVSRAIETIERNAKLQNKLIEDLLDVSRIIQNQLEISRQSVSLVPVIDSVIEALQPSAKAKSIEIASSLDSAVGQVLGDESRLEQIVSNLLSNAIKFTPAGGRIEVGLQRAGSLAEITITDTGQGISANFLPFLFERFRQADSSKTRSQGGLGLGLAIVRHLVELHGGSVYATSAGEGKGSTFTVQLPIQEIPLTLALDSSGKGARELPSLASLRILVVDDDLDNRELIAFVLEQQQAQVTLAESAMEALNILSQVDIDILISDIGMPDEDGYSLIRRIRALKGSQKRRIPAIALTAFAKEEDQQASTAAGFQYHLSKPVNPDDLIVVVANLASLVQ